MLDIKRIRTNPEEMKAGLASRGVTGVVEKLLALDEKRRELIVKTESLKARRNEVSKKIPAMKKAGEDTAALMEEMKRVSEETKRIDAELAAIDDEITAILLGTPNVPLPDVPVGESERDNKEVRRWGEPRQFDFEPKAHWDIGTMLGILDFETAARVTGARFVFYKGLGSRLERALISFMLDLHTLEGPYTEVFPPYMVSRASMVGTGQLPKFKDDMFWVSRGGDETQAEQYLISTSEIPLTNSVRERILEPGQLPLRLTAHSPCFRSEAGSAGRDTRGMIRQHQFDKVEMVQITTPEASYAALEAMVAHAEAVLQRLELPYRVMALAAGDMGFASAKTCDLEVWLPGQGAYREISSCSNCEAFQARRMQARWRNAAGKTEFVHTLNGSGVAVGRALVAVLENHQQADGSVRVPAALRPYLGGLDVLGA